MDDSEFFLPSSPPSDLFIPAIRIHPTDVFLCVLDARKAYDPDGILHLVLKNYDCVLTQCIVKLLPFFLLELCVHFLCPKEVWSILSLQLPISAFANFFVVYLYLEEYRTSTDGMDFAKNSALVIFWLSLLNFGVPLFRASVKPLLLPLTQSKAIDGVWHKSLVPNYYFKDSFGLCIFYFKVFIMHDLLSLL